MAQPAEGLGLLPPHQLCYVIAGMRQDCPSCLQYRQVTVSSPGYCARVRRMAKLRLEGGHSLGILLGSLIYIFLMRFSRKDSCARTLGNKGMPMSPCPSDGHPCSLQDPLMLLSLWPCAPGPLSASPPRMTFHRERASGSTIIFVYLKVEGLILLPFCNVLTSRRCRIM